MNLKKLDYKQNQQKSINFRSINIPPDMMNTIRNNNAFENTISLKYDSTKLNVDASGNLTVVSGGTSQWTTTGTSIFYNTGNVGIGTNNPNYKLH